MVKKLKGFLTMAEACSRAGISLATLFNWRKQGLVEYKFAQTVLIKETDLEDFLKKNPTRGRGRRTSKVT